MSEFILFASYCHPVRVPDGVLAVVCPTWHALFTYAPCNVQVTVDEATLKTFDVLLRISDFLPFKVSRPNASSSKRFGPVRDLSWSRPFIHTHHSADGGVSKHAPIGPSQSHVRTASYIHAVCRCRVGVVWNSDGLAHELTQNHPSTLHRHQRVQLHTTCCATVA